MGQRHGSQFNRPISTEPTKSLDIKTEYALRAVAPLVNIFNDLTVKYDLFISLRKEVWAHKTSFLLTCLNKTKEVGGHASCMLGVSVLPPFLTLVYWNLEMFRKCGICCFSCYRGFLCFPSFLFNLLFHWCCLDNPEQILFFFTFP